MSGRLLPSTEGRLLYIRNGREYYVTRPSEADPTWHLIETATGFPAPESTEVNLSDADSILLAMYVLAGEDEILQRTVWQDLNDLALQLVYVRQRNGNDHSSPCISKLIEKTRIADLVDPPDANLLDEALRMARELAQPLDPIARQGFASALIPALELIGAKESAKLVHVALRFEEDAAGEAGPKVESEGDRQTRIAALHEKAQPILAAHDAVDAVELGIHALGYGGNLRIPLIVYLAATTRLLAMRTGAMPAHLLLLGGPSSGKTYPLTLVKQLLPFEAFHCIDASSRRALIYDEVDLRHRMVVFSEIDSMPQDDENPATSALRNLLQEHSLSYDVVEKDQKSGKFCTRKIRRPGPTVVVTTGVRRPEPQLDSRFFSLEVPDDHEQIKAALAVQGRLYIRGPTPPDPVLIAYQGYLQALAPWSVVVPFVEVLARKLGERSRAPRVFRDFARLVALVAAVTILRHTRRRRDGEGRLVADLEDYARVRDLVEEMYAGAAGVSPVTRKAVGVVAELRAAGRNPVTVAMVAESLNLNPKTAWRRLKSALQGRWLVNEELQRGRAARLVLGDSLPPESGLPTPDELDLGATPTRAPFLGCPGGKVEVKSSQNNDFWLDTPPEKPDLPCPAGSDESGPGYPRPSHLDTGNGVDGEGGEGAEGTGDQNPATSEAEEDPWWTEEPDAPDVPEED